MKLQPTDAAGRARSPRPRPPPAQFLPGVESGRARVWRRLDFGESSLLGMNYSTRDGVCMLHTAAEGETATKDGTEGGRVLLLSHR